MAFFAEILRIIRIANDGPDPGHVFKLATVTFLVVATGALVLIAASRHRDTRRLAELRALLPNAFVGQFFVGANLLDAIAWLKASGRIHGKLPLNTLVDVSADEIEVRFYKGGAKPRLLLSLPSSMVRSVTADDCETIRGTRPSVNITLPSGDAAVKLPLLISRTTAFGATQKNRDTVKQLAAEMSARVLSPVTTQTIPLSERPPSDN
ncbi:hypothetical protein [Glaciihabitans sp. UYNi722]|uniref:hypothetical protein n=1 Tax=Glaciihabitans sp. UYNi722 TaxID=3156344 RepID=UPI00339B45F3